MLQEITQDTSQRRWGNLWGSQLSIYRPKRRTLKEIGSPTTTMCTSSP
jgi:hypothetical protein